ncbi:snakin-2-like [Impatiens glandulifera]|uniref:snakin-2-like n=1 Tax=Impatiens glandulifera TaxID=253017 RepID=UPI001FB0CEE5|nr:snakin-2-like [Impatiens glandulifera]
MATAKALLFLLSSLLLVTIHQVSSSQVIKPQVPTYGGAPQMAPIYPPSIPVDPAVIPRRCAAMCVAYCDIKMPGMKRDCQRVCSACCAKCNCIPLPGAKPCNGTWDKVIYHKIEVACP